MIDFVLISLYSVTAISILSYAFVEMYSFGRLNFRIFSLFNISLLYFIVPIFIRITGEGISPNFIHFRFPEQSILFFLFLPLSWGAVASFLIAYSASTRFRYRFQVSTPSPISFILTLALIGAICWIIYIQLYGGIGYVLQNLSGIRSGTDENKNYLGALMRIFADFIVFAAFFAFSHYRAKARWMAPVFTFVFALALAKLFLDGGRGGLINLFIGMYFIFVQSSGRIGFLPVVFLLTVGYYVGTYGKILLFSLFTDIRREVLLQNAAEASAGIANVISEYSHQFLSTLVALENSSIFSDRFGMDFFIWAIKPLKLAGVPVPDSISFYNTYLITGVWDSEVPPGIIALGFYNFGAMLYWVPIFLWGLLCSTLDRSFRASNARNEPNVRAIYAILFVFLPFGLLNSDPALLFQWCISVFSLLFFLKVFGISKIRRIGLF